MVSLPDIIIVSLNKNTITGYSLVTITFLTVECNNRFHLYEVRAYHDAYCKCTIYSTIFTILKITSLSVSSSPKLDLNINNLGI